MSNDAPLGGSAEPVAPPPDELRAEWDRIRATGSYTEQGAFTERLLAVLVCAPQGDPPRYENDLAHLATLAPNWDSYDGVPITPAAIAAVRAFIAHCYK